MMDGSASLLWDSYVLRKGDDARTFWKEHLSGSNRDILYVIGLGFDPRMCDGLEMILHSGTPNTLNCYLVEIDEGPDSSTRQLRNHISINNKKFNDLIKGRGKSTMKRIEMWTGGGLNKRRVGQRNAANLFKKYSEIESYTDIIVDISAMPRGIYLPMIGKLMYLIEQERLKFSNRPLLNLHIIVSENVKLDNKIQTVGVDDEADYLFGSGRGNLDTEGSAYKPRIWIPILGEGQKEQLERIHELIKPDEICPVLPSPSANPRRGDDLLLEYRELFFIQWMVEPRNILYASENNPFEAYRRICEVIRHYEDALDPLGGCIAVVSANSSKLLSIGALLSTYEMRKKISKNKIALAHVESQGYNLSTMKTGKLSANEKNIFSIWLIGDCYDDQ